MVNIDFWMLRSENEKIRNLSIFLLSPYYENLHSFDEERHQSLLDKKGFNIWKYHSLKISSGSIQVQETYETKVIHYWFYIIRPKIYKLLTHIRVSRIKLCIEKAFYLDSPWLVDCQETQNRTKIRCPILTKMRHAKPLCY